MPFTSDDFDPQLEQAFELMPDLLGAEGAEIRYAINGLLSLTPDGAPVLGETPEVKGLWSAAAVWIKEGPGVGRAVAEWMTNGLPEIDLSHSDIARFYPHQQTRAHVRARTGEAFIKTYGIVHPGEQYESDRDQRLAPMHAQQVEHGRAVLRGRRLGAARSGTSPTRRLLEEYGDRVMPREHEWDARWWSPIINAEHLAMRDRAGIVDLSAFAIFDVVGPAAMAAVQGICVSQCDVAVGRVVYTPVLDERGGFRSDLTVMRLAHDRFRVVTGGAHGMVDRKWFADRMPADGTALVVDLTSAYTTIGLWGPQARAILGRADPRRHQPRGLPLRHLPRHRGRLDRPCWPPGSPTSASWAGSCTCPSSRAPGSGRRCTRPARRTARCRSASGSTRTTGRLEKGYRAFGYELDSERTIIEAGMARPKVKTADFVGRDAYLKQRVEDPAHGAVHPDRRRPHLGLRREALHARRRAHPDRRRRRARRRPRPPSLRDLGGLGARRWASTCCWPTCRPRWRRSARSSAVSYMEELYPVTVGSADSTPLFDPTNDTDQGMTERPRLHQASARPRRRDHA